jgi:hypothetical protein
MNRYFRYDLYIVVFVALFFSSCATGSGSLSIREPSFNPQNANIALLPPRYALGAATGIVIGKDRKFGDLIFKTLKRRTSSQWTPSDDAVSKIQDANALPEYEALLDGYQKTGIASKDRLQKIGAVIGVQNIALCTISYSVSGIMGMSNYRNASLTFQILSTQTGQVLLEIMGTAECGSGAYDIGEDKLFQKTVDAAINYYPSAIPAE